MDNLIIRPIEDHEYDQVTSIISSILGNRTPEKWKEIWKWRYNENPAWSKCSHQFYVGEVENKIVGVIGLIPYRVKLENKIVTIVSPVDLAVKKESRSKGYGSKIRKGILNKNIAPFFISTSCNEHTHKMSIYMGGAEILESKNRYIKPLSSKGYLKKMFSKSLIINRLAHDKLLSVLSVPIDMYLKSDIFFPKYSKYSYDSIENVDTFDDRFDTFWNIISKDYKFIFVRDSKYLNWRYSKYPFGGIESFSFSRGKKILGFAVIYTGIGNDALKFTSILELITLRSDFQIYEILLQEIISRSIKYGCDCILTITANKVFKDILRRYGFKVKRMDYTPYTYKNNMGIPDELLCISENWHISLGDGDAGFY